MKVKEILTESLSHADAIDIITQFVKYAARELQLSQLPKIKLHTNNKYSVNFKSFGSYGNGEINLTIANRHINDCLRTLAHELTHYKQDLNDQLTNESGADGSPEENEANATAAVIMRKWAKMNPSLFNQTAIE